MTNGRIPVAALAAALALALAACGNGAPEPTAATPTASATPATTPTPAPTVSPATGLRLKEETSSVRAPKGDWERAEPLVSWASSVDGPGRFDSIQLVDRPSLAGDTTLNSLARTAVKMLSKDRQPKRLPNVELDGSPAYVIRYSEPGLPGVSYDIVTLHDGHSVVVNVILGKKSQHAKIVKSVVASFRWLD